MDGRRGKVVCHLRIGGDLKKVMKQEMTMLTTITYKVAIHIFLLML